MRISKRIENVNSDSSDTQETVENQESDTDEDDGTTESKRDKTFEVSTEDVTCIIEYESAMCDRFEYVDEGETDHAVVSSEAGYADFRLTKGSISAEDYIEKFKQEKEAGNNSYYYVKDLNVEERHTYDANGYSYKSFDYSYIDVYTEMGAEYENYGVLGYVQLTGDVAILIDDFNYEDWAEFIESSFFVKEVNEK